MMSSNIAGAMQVSTRAAIVTRLQQHGGAASRPIEKQLQCKASSSQHTCNSLMTPPMMLPPFFSRSYTCKKH